MGPRSDETQSLTRSISFKTRQQLQRILAANPFQIVCGEPNLAHTFSSLTQGNERVVTAKQNLRGGDQARQRRNRRSICRTRNIVMKSPEFIFDSIGRLLCNVLGPVLVHTSKQHGHVSARVRKDESGWENTGE